MRDANFLSHEISCMHRPSKKLRFLVIPRNPRSRFTISSSQRDLLSFAGIKFNPLLLSSLRSPLSNIQTASTMKTVDLHTEIVRRRPQRRRGGGVPPTKFCMFALKADYNKYPLLPSLPSLPGRLRKRARPKIGFLNLRCSLK